MRSSAIAIALDVAVGRLGLKVVRLVLRWWAPTSLQRREGLSLPKASSGVTARDSCASTFSEIAPRYAGQRDLKDSGELTVEVSCRTFAGFLSGRE